MIQINLVQPSSLIINDLDRHPIMATFIEQALLTGGIEVRWEYIWEHAPEEQGFLILTAKRFITTNWIGVSVLPPPVEQRQESM